MVALDNVIVDQYRQFNTPADQIVSNPDLAQQFFDAVTKAFEGECELDLVLLNRRLLSLRKRGEENGGLPRLRRAYSGRNRSEGGKNEG